MPATTVFFRGAEGVSGGAYVFVDKDVNVPGRLSDCHALGESDVSCRWQDKYGVGNLLVTFSADRQSFLGAWTANGAAEGRKYCWSGRAAE